MHSRFSSGQRLLLWIAAVAAGTIAAYTVGIAPDMLWTDLMFFGLTVFSVLLAHNFVSAASDHNECYHKNSIIFEIISSAGKAFSYTAIVGLGWFILRLLPF